jgi:hypothetical protein
LLKLIIAKEKTNMKNPKIDPEIIPLMIGIFRIKDIKPPRIEPKINPKIKL